MVLTLLVVLMTVEGFSKVETWEQFNSSLLIEVTRGKGVFTCTGVAVSDTLIVTAAHCLEGNVTKVRVFTQINYNPKQTSLDIASYKVHPEYEPSKSNYRNDIAKIVMKEKLPAFIKLLPIHQGNTVIGDLYRFGFGARNDKNARTVITPTFRQVNVADKVVELNDKFSRSGDSGGPIYLRNGDNLSILAIHSTFSSGPQGNFSYNPLLNTYLPWIYQN